MLKIKDRTITRDGEPYLTGEIGHNHQGSVKQAMSMMSTLKAAGWHAAKLQKRTNRVLFSSKLYNAPYDSRNAYGATYGEHREALEFGKDDFKTLIEWAEEINLHLFATAFDFPAADFLMDLNMPAFKIASGDITNTPLLRYIANFGRPMFVSTGGAVLDDVRRAVDLILSLNPQLCIMQCTSAYPCPPEGESYDVFKEFQDVVVGFSDHQSGIALGPAALPYGAVVFEKHVTFDRTAKGTDHPFSLEPVGQRKYARDIYRAWEALGDGVKKRYPFEEKPLYKMAKSITAAEDLIPGTILETRHVVYLCPGDGLPPYRIEELVGKKLRRFVARETQLRLEDFE